MEQPRIDLWLKHVCLVKHRTDATDACKGGLVKLNGQRVKPAGVVRIDDVVELTEPRYRKVVVLAIPDKQLSKDAAHAAYRDETPPPPPVEAPVIYRDRGAGRPTKKERREIEKWRGGS